MELSIYLWVEYLLRFSHLVAGILWVGSSFYFIWLDSNFLPPESPRKNVEGEVFMVHGGFYYQVEKKKIVSGEIPKILHWFKWEATLTLISGYFLFGFLYFLNGASLLIDPSISDLSQFQAVSLCTGLIVASWLIYDFIWHPNIMKSKVLSLILSVLFFSGLIFTCIQFFSGRGAFITIGAILGSLMVLNVWVRILPGQTKMLKEATAGEVPDYSVSLKSKVRSVHNTYFIFPVLFIMISNHYPMIYNHPQNWLLLIVLGISGALVRHTMVSKNPKHRWLLVPASLGLIFLVYFTALAGSNATSNSLSKMSENNSFLPVTYSEVESIVSKRCLSCHSTNNTDDIFKVAPKGIIFETQQQIIQLKDKIYTQVVTGKVMPLGNKTKMTLAEREVFARWIKSL